MPIKKSLLNYKRNFMHVEEYRKLEAMCERQIFWEMRWMAVRSGHTVTSHGDNFLGTSFTVDVTVI